MVHRSAKPNLPFEPLGYHDDAVLERLFNSAAYHLGDRYQDHAPRWADQPQTSAWVARHGDRPVAGGWLRFPVPGQLLVVVVVEPGWAHLAEGLFEAVERQIAAVQRKAPEPYTDIAAGLTAWACGQALLESLERRGWRVATLT